jgi:dihydrofolate synthase/folylpolyglutamate synthase
LLAPQPYPEVVEVAQKIASDVGATLVLSEEVGGRSEALRVIAEKKGWPDYLIDNATVALQALDLLDILYRIDDLHHLELFGRFYRLRENIRIDVGHNPLAAQAIVKAMERDTVLIYNSLDDKDYEAVLRILKPKLKRVEIIPIESQRATTRDAIADALDRVGLPYRMFDGTIDKEEHYLVFGSFYTVESFLKTGGFQKSE